MILKSINPFTNEVSGEFEEYTEDQVENILIQSTEAYNSWKRTDFCTRRSLMEKAAAMLLLHIEDYALTITTEMGKPIKESKAEVEKCAWVCEYYAINAEKFLSRESVETDADISYIAFEPLGPVLGIMPWNFPFWQVFRFAVPTIMAGNSVLLKHASNVQICAKAIESIFAKSGFPDSLFRNLVVGSPGMGKIIKHNSIKAVSLTGSVTAGENVAAVAGSTIKKSVLELGGSNAFIVLEDAEIKKAVDTGIRARYQNAGQSCIAAKRFIIHKRILDRFLELFLKGVKELKTGDPADEKTDIGPLVSIRQAEKVRMSTEMGAKIITGGLREKAFFHPTVVIDVKPGMPLFDEEVFGPVAPIIVAENTDESIKLANQTTFGLGVTLFTGDLEKAITLVNKFDDGAVFINGLVKSDPRLPFGGTKRSGFGRELALQGIREFVNVKTVWAKKP
jgi:succinate-semialdehyde dehydrogenase/glutarate-semialdehyde dehydrogenase